VTGRILNLGYRTPHEGRLTLQPVGSMRVPAALVLLRLTRKARAGRLSGGRDLLEHMFGRSVTRGASRVCSLQRRPACQAHWRLLTSPLNR